MKNLTFVRHGKSGYEIGLPDKQRTLNKTGIEKSRIVADEFKKHLPKQFSIHSSTAIRAKMTAIIFANIFGIRESEIFYYDQLYTFDGFELEKIIKLTSDNVTNLLIFGHNEGITDFVNKFGSINIDNVPTSGLVSIDFESDNWSKIKNGITIKTIFPKEL